VDFYSPSTPKHI